MIDRGGGNRLVWSFGILALLVRLVVTWLNVGGASPIVTNPDSQSYIDVASSLVQDFSFVGEAEAWRWCRPPGYPALLALVFASGVGAPERLAGVVLVQVLLSSAVVALAVRLAFLLGGRWRAALVGSLLVFEPSSIAYSNLVISETFYTFILIAGVLAWWSWLDRPEMRRLVAFALLISALPLIRPVGLHLPWILCPLVFWRARAPRRLMQAALFLLLALLPSAAWLTRNWVQYGSATFDQTGPLAMAQFARQVELRAGAPDPPSGPEALWHRHYADGDVVPAPEAMARQAKYFSETVKSHPAEVVEELLYTGATLVGVPDSFLPLVVTGHVTPFEEGSVAGRLRWLGAQGPLVPLLLLGMVVSVGGVLLVPLFAWRVWRWGPIAQACGALVVVMLLYHLALASFVRYQSERYRVPIIPLMALTLVLGATGAPRGVGENRGVR